MTYFSLLPHELLLELSLYFNYLDTILVCEFLKCERIDLWLYKIEKELGYSTEFIREYVYDKTNKTVKTLLPINEKYLELKARKSVDFGTEFYQPQHIQVTRASRLNDFNFANKLTHYFLHISKCMPKFSYDLNYGATIARALGNGNILLATELTNNPPYNFELKPYIVRGIYERYP